MQVRAQAESEYPSTILDCHLLSASFNLAAQALGPVPLSPPSNNRLSALRVLPPKPLSRSQDPRPPQLDFVGRFLSAAEAHVVRSLVTEELRAG